MGSGDKMRQWMIRLIRRYQEGTRHKNPTCRFRPTCSEYAIDSYQNYNFFYATLLTIWRILRCNPFSKGGYDPIPKIKKPWKEQQKREEQMKKDAESH